MTAADATGSVSQIVSMTRTAAPLPAGTDTTGPALTITYPSSHVAGYHARLADVQGHGVGSFGSRQRDVVDQYGRGWNGFRDYTSLTTQWTAAIPLLVGFNQVIIRAYDTVGNMSWRSVVVSADSRVQRDWQR